MATQTPNLGLTLPSGTENVSRQVINTNFSLIDGAVGELQEAKLLTAGTDYTYTVLDNTTTIDLLRLYQVGKNHFYIVMQFKDPTAWDTNVGMGIQLSEINGYNKFLTKTYLTSWGGIPGYVSCSSSRKIAIYNAGSTAIPSNTVAMIATDFYMFYES